MLFCIIPRLTAAHSANNKNLPGGHKIHADHNGAARATGILISTTPEIGSGGDQEGSLTASSAIGQSEATHHSSHTATNESTVVSKGNGS